MTVSDRREGRRLPVERNRLFKFLSALIFCFLILLLSGADAADITAVLKWTAPADNNYEKCASYEIRYSPNKPGDDKSIWWNQATSVLGIPQPSAPGRKDSCIVGNLSHQNIYYFAIRSADKYYNRSKISNVVSFPNLSCADANDDDDFDILDIYFLLEYLFKDGVKPPAESGDVNNSGSIDIADVVHLINYKFRSGYPPCLVR